MVDGTGMCGGCRVTIDGETRYACVDGPEFDGHTVDFRELSDRLTTYRPFEQAAMERRACEIGLRTKPKPGAADVAADEPAQGVPA
jgi:ferredoxin--NADP+ reductase